jgi:hypothetical protein
MRNATAADGSTACGHVHVMPNGVVAGTGAAGRNNSW